MQVRWTTTFPMTDSAADPTLRIHTPELGRCKTTVLAVFFQRANQVGLPARVPLPVGDT